MSDPRSVAGAIDTLAAAAVPIAVAAGGVVCRAGDPADALIIVVDGAVEILDAPDATTTVFARSGELAGDFPSLSATRTVTVRGVTDAICARIPCAALEQSGLTDAAAVSKLAPLLTQTLLRWHLLAAAAARLGLDESAVRALEGHVQWRVVRRGAVLMHEGAEGDSLFVLISGRLQATREKSDGTVVIVGDIAAGETIGEMSFFTGQPRSATVAAIRDSVVVRLPHDVFERLIATRPDVVRQVTRIQMERIRRANQRLTAPTRITNVAVVPLGDGVPSHEFCQRLALSLQTFGLVLHLSAGDVDQRLQHNGLAETPEDSSDEARLLAWLGDQETRWRFVLYEADRSRPGWLARSIRQADCVLLVGRSEDSPEVTEAERQVMPAPAGGTSAGRILVLIHPDGSRLPRNTHAWLEPRNLTAHHHVRWDRDGDISRIARFLAGRAVALVLGGGGARGLAHVGVMAALTEAGVPIDLIGGTSIGAAMAAQFAMGWSREKMVAENLRIWLSVRPHKAYTLPVLALIDKGRSLAVSEEVYGSTRIEDLWVPYFCVSSDLTAAAMRVHRSGSLLTAATASATLPGVFVPVVEDMHLLVDGAVFNNLPGDVAREMGCGELVVSRVSIEEDRAFLYDRLPTLGQVLRHYLTPWRPQIRYPSLIEVAMRAAMLASINRENAVSRDADFFFQPPVEPFGLMEFTALETIVDTGYEYAVARLQEWRHSGQLSRIVAPVEQAEVGSSVRA